MGGAAWWEVGQEVPGTKGAPTWAADVVIHNNNRQHVEGLE